MLHDHSPWLRCLLALGAATAAACRLAELLAELPASPAAPRACSMAAQVKYVWPIQQAITDFGAQRQRLKEVRSRLGWRILGCDLLECFEE